MRKLISVTQTHIDEGTPDNVKPFRFYVTDWAF